MSLFPLLDVLKNKCSLERFISLNLLKYTVGYISSSLINFIDVQVASFIKADHNPITVRLPRETSRPMRVEAEWPIIIAIQVN